METNANIAKATKEKYLKKITKKNIKNKIHQMLL